jgi:glycosyltransferase involved in cell wall biosynthesis
MTATAPPGRTWVHVSTLLQWNRPPVGIVRVEQEYCRWLLAQQPAQVGELRFCRYDKRDACFLEVARDVVAGRLGSPAGSAHVPAPPAVPTGTWLSRWLADLGQRAAVARRHVLHWLVTQSVLRRPLAPLRAWRRHRYARATTPLSAPFAPGDRWVSLGLDWDTLDQRALYEAKLRFGLDVTLMCYDVIPVLFPHLVVVPGDNFAAYITDAAWCADRFACISECTRRDLLAVSQRLGAPRRPRTVVRLGAQVPGGGEARPPAGFGADPRPFVLYVSTIERRKNHELLYRAWLRLRERGLTTHRLVWVGMRGWGVGDLMHDLHLDPRIRGDILLLDRVADDELAWLYRHCAFTVFPSLYEGWGLPVAESLACGKFCLASNAASLPEVGGDLIEYLDPWDLPQWVERLAHYMTDPRAVAEHEQRIAREYWPPAWADTAAAIHRVVLQGQAPEAGR